MDASCDTCMDASCDTCMDASCDTYAMLRYVYHAVWPNITAIHKATIISLLVISIYKFRYVGRTSCRRLASHNPYNLIFCTYILPVMFPYSPTARASYLCTFSCLSVATVSHGPAHVAVNRGLLT